MTTKTNFTPGPWETDSKDHDQPYLPYAIRPKAAPWQQICKVWQDDAPVPDYNAEQKANAHLIAAAPDLYDALQNLLSRLANDADGHTWFMDEQEASITALAKARGEA